MEFDIRLYAVNDNCSEFKKMRQQIEEMKEQVYKIQKNISIRSASVANIQSSLATSQENMELIIKKLALLENGLELAVKLYLNCERAVISKQKNQTSQDGKRSGLSGWWNNFKEWKSTGIWNEPEKAATVKRDKVMVKELQKLLKSERFNKRTWKKASIEERKQILRELFEQMQGIYGVKLLEVNIVEISSEPGSVTNGYYDTDTNSVYINMGMLSEKYENVVQVMAHEMRHGYQYWATENPEAFQIDADTVEEWRDNFLDYKTVEDDGYNAYYNQSIERDARKFAEWVI